MKIVKPEVHILNRQMDYPTLLKFIESIGRTCYKSNSQFTMESGEEFVRRLIRNGHESVLEHGHFTIKFICDRGVTHELVRHRNTAYSQESTRYCNYSLDKFDKEISVIKPWSIEPGDQTASYINAAVESEKAYFKLLEYGVKPEIARSVLPTSLKTEIVFTMNIRELRSFLKIRTTSAVHPQMLQLTIPLLKKLAWEYPAFFEDLLTDYVTLNMKVEAAEVIME